MTPKLGIYPGVPFAEYRSWEAVNASFLTTLSNRSPHHAKHDQDHPKPETDAKRVGRALHSYVLEPATFKQLWAVWAKLPRNTKEGKASWAAFEQQLAGRDWISAVEFAEIEALATEIRKQQCLNLICAGRAEVSLVWLDKETGVLCKRRLDYERSSTWDHYITDLKSTEDARERLFSNAIAKFGYALAAAFSIDGWLALTGETSNYSLLAVEKDYHIAKVWEPDDDTIEAGRQDYRAALAMTAQCMKTGEWPAYGNKPELIRAPEWYLQLHGVGRDRVFAQAQSEVNYTTGPEPEPDEFDTFMDAK